MARGVNRERLPPQRGGRPAVYPSQSVPRPPGPRSTRRPPLLSFLRRLLAGPPSIDVAELEALLAAGSIRVLDVREDHEFRQGHLPGAIHIPAKRLPDRVRKLKRDKPYAVICASGSRSRGATSYLLEQGVEGAVSVRGGTGAWARGGRPLAR